MTSDEIESFINSRYGELSSDEIVLLMDVDKNPQIDHLYLKIMHGRCGIIQVANFISKKELGCKIHLYYSSILCYAPFINHKEVMQMARRGKVANNYDELITREQKILEKLEADKVAILGKIKEKKAEIKKLEKAKDTYDARIAEEERTKQMKEVATMIVNSGKTMDEIKEFLTK